MDTLSSEWFKLKMRWVTSLGILYYILTFETMESLYSHFGVVKDFAKYSPLARDFQVEEGRSICAMSKLFILKKIVKMKRFGG